MKININNIVTNENQPRKHFDEEKIKELANSILFDGLQEPILVRPLPDGKFEIVQGERRYRAHKQANLSEIEVKIKDMDDKEAFHLAVIENIQREQLTPIEEANAYFKYVEMGFTHEQIAKKISKSRVHVTSRLRLLKLLPFIHDWIAEGYLSDGHAKQILKMEAILERFLKDKEPNKFINPETNQTRVESHFENFQWKFHASFWHKHDIKKEKLTVNEVKQWVEGWRYGFIESTILQYMGMGSAVVDVNRGLPMTAEMDCNLYNLHINNLIEEDIDFAIEFDLNRNKDNFSKEFRPWMIEKHWDDLRNELFPDDRKDNWNVKNFKDSLETIQKLKESVLSDDLAVLTSEIKFYKDQLQEACLKSGMTVDEMLEDIFIKENKEK